MCFSLAAHSAVVLKAESAADKVEWINRISNVIQAKGGQIRISSEGGSTMRQSLSDGSLVSCWLIAVVHVCSISSDAVTRLAHKLTSFLRMCSI